MPSAALLRISAAPDPRWQPLALPGWTSAFLGWPRRGDDDAGPSPATIARLAAGLAATAPTLFLAAVPDDARFRGWTGQGSDTQICITASPWALRRHGAPAGIRLVLSREAALLETAFDQPGFDWTQRGQLLFLCEPAALPPAPDEVFAAMAQDPPRSLPQACIALWRPATDGDFAECAAGDAAVLAALMMRFVG